MLAVDKAVHKPAFFPRRNREHSGRISDRKFSQFFAVLRRTIANINLSPGNRHASVVNDSDDVWLDPDIVRIGNAPGTASKYSPDDSSAHL